MGILSEENELKRIDWNPRNRGNKSILWEKGEKGIPIMLGLV